MTIRSSAYNTDSYAFFVGLMIGPIIAGNIAARVSLTNDAPVKAPIHLTFLEGFLALVLLGLCHCSSH